jgi:chromosome segregation ATPase
MAVALSPAGRGATTAPVTPELEAMITRANAEVSRRASSGLELFAMVVLDQRDRAYAELGRLGQQWEASRRLDMEEHDRFIVFLMADYERQLQELRGELAARPSGEVTELALQLLAASAELDEARADAARLQGERDEAIRETSDVRYECQRQIEQARDEAVDLQWKLDELTRTLDDERDQAREHAYQLAEQLEDARTELARVKAELDAIQGPPTWSGH